MFIKKIKLHLTTQNQISMKIFFAFALSLLSLQAFSQSDSTDLNLYTTPYSFENEIDSMLFGDENLHSYFIEFTIEDTIAFGYVYLELFTDEGHILYKNKFSVEDLQNNGYLNAQWLVKIDLGAFAEDKRHKINLTISNYANVYGPLLTKHF